tara:strand:- start:176 stop:295 length:120 start_codon:yes stop_codon:yes gene_type:complete
LPVVVGVPVIQPAVVMVVKVVVVGVVKVVQLGVRVIRTV